MKKFSIFTTTAFAVALLVAGCSKSESADDMVDYFPVQTESGGNWSFMSPDGGILYDGEFKQQPSLVINGFFSVAEGEGISLYKVGDRPELVKNCDNLYGVGFMNEGLVPIVRPKSRISVIDENGNEKFTLQPVKGKEIVSANAGYSDGMLAVTNEDGLIGFVDKNGKVVIEPKYNTSGDFSDGLACVSIEDKASVINKKGETVFTLKADWTPIRTAYDKGYILLSDPNDHIVFADKKGEMTKCPSKVKMVGQYDDTYYSFSDGDGWGVMKRKDNEIVIRAKYNSIFILQNGNFLCESDDKTTIRNDKDETLATLEDYKTTYPVGKFGILAKEKNTILLLDIDGKPIKNAEFADFGSYQYAGNGVNSDYFGMEGMADRITELVNAEGYGKLAIGISPSKILTAPKNYTYTKNVELDTLSGSGYRYNFTVRAEFTENIADCHYDYDYYTYQSKTEYAWNPQSKLDGVSIEVNSTTELGEDGVKAVVKALEAKGFKVVETKYENKGGAALLKTAKLLALIASGEKSNDLKLGIGRYSPETEKLVKSMVSGEAASSTALVEAVDSSAAAEESIEMPEDFE